MPSAGDIYGSRFLRVEDIPVTGLQGMITTIGPVEMSDQAGNDRTKLVLELEGAGKPVILNATNSLVLIEAWGDDYSQWAGKVLRIFRGKTMFRGKLVDSMKMAVVADGKPPEAGK